jgi:hypothetical protein
MSADFGKLPSAAVSYSSAGPALGTSGCGENRPKENENRGRFFVSSV